jgi:isopentenyldiphosphate isomerase
MQMRLDSRVWRKYKEVVLKCLTGELGIEDDTTEDLKLQQAFRYQVVDVIEMAGSYVWICLYKRVISASSV